MKQFLLVLAVAVLGLASCSKPENSKQPADSLRQTKWAMTTYTVKYQYGASDTVLDLYSHLDTCHFDDYYTFNEDFQGAINTATKKCGSESDQIPFQWELRDNNKTLMINNAQYLIGNTGGYMTPGGLPVIGGMEYVEATVKKLNAATLTINYQYVKQTSPNTPKVTYFFTQTFNRVL